ncbi:winged helix-turn-helix transcriptional regulator [Limisphaera ngatamarikiensis]|jgi:DNA-binding transcriptional ArsR family regulator|uniref:Winged helix-turn-helix transcriptional regulator n=2 Tax=Limisphaera ngatamarikiensis TaxID=1324935 RepID=A0A6M1RM48_9BACT|nr:winged helix-turn-helix transcriptional regulator [Limisphaera ngatamarikiensis]
MARVVAVAGALSDRQRLRILAALEGRECCVCQLVALLGLAVSTVSRHLSVLERAGLIQSRKEGRWVYYRRVARPGSEVVRGALGWALKAVAGDSCVQADRRALERILSQDPHGLCRRLCRGGVRGSGGARVQRPVRSP